MNVGGNIIRIKSAALLGKPHLFSVPATQLQEPKNKTKKQYRKKRLLLLKFLRMLTSPTKLGAPPKRRSF